VQSFKLDLSVIEFQTLVLRGEFEQAQELEIPEEQKTKVARFLEGQGFKEEALAMVSHYSIPDFSFTCLLRCRVRTQITDSI
jgi:spore maturation protein CgeB